MDDTKSSVTDDLRRRDFESLLLRLDTDRESAGQKYERLRRKLIKFFEWSRCFPAEDLADETLDRVARRVGREDVGRVLPFAWGVANHVRRESGRRTRRLVALPDLPGREVPRPEEDVESDLHDRLLNELRVRCLEACLRRLAPEDRDLFLAYYEAREDRSAHRLRLAAAAGLTIQGLRVRVNRLREKLEGCVSRGIAPPAARPGLPGFPRPGRGRRE
jgi:DNA-directed RNA polymerase specialized sigma24 family protein